LPFLLRKINYKKWIRNPDLDSWLNENEIPADSLNDLIFNLKNNSISAWKVEDDNSNLNDIIIALATNPDYISELSYILIDLNILPKYGIEYNEISGETKYNKANQLWHLNLIKLSGKKALILAQEFFNKGEKKRIYKKQLLKLFEKNRKILKNLEIENLKDDVRKHISDLI